MVVSRSVLALLGLACLLLLAGCSAPGSISLEPVTDEELADEASRLLPSHGAAEERALVRGAVENGSATVEGRDEPVETAGPPFAVDGAYYDLSVDVVDRHTQVQVDLRVDYNGSVDGRAVAYADLSAADRALVDAVLPPRDDRRSEGSDRGVVDSYTRDEAAESVLLAGDYAAIRYEGERYPIDVDDREHEVRTYRYTAEAVAPDAATYAESLRERYAFTLPGLSEAERSVVAEATNGSYYAEDDDEAFRSVLERFRGHEAVFEDEYHGEWVVRYRGTVYWAELKYGGYAE